MDNEPPDKTMRYQFEQEEEMDTREILTKVYSALEEKGYNPINQLVGYFISGDPTYITSYQNARALIRRIERDEFLEEILSSFLQDN